MTAEPTLHIKTLGGLSIELNGRPITTFVSSKAEALLVYLALTQRQHPRETLADLLWDDRTQRQAMSNLRTVLYSLRKEAGPFVDITRKTAAINPDANLSIDALELETAVPQTGIQSEEQAQKAENALSLYNGDFLAGFFLPEAAEFESWTAVQRERFHRLFIDASLQLGQWHLTQQQYPAAITTATRLLQIDPLAEAGHRQLIESLARNNQRAEALAQYEKCQQILDEELGLEPETETLALYETIRSDTLPAQEPTTSEEPVQSKPKPMLPPQPAPILGREKELEELQQLLTNNTQLVTIVGPGGMGKTRLALEAAHRLANQFEDGAAFVSLASLSSVDDVVPAVAKAIRFEIPSAKVSKAQEQLFDHLRPKKLLLTLDNLEHLLDAAPLITQLVQTAPDVRLLVTSRERLKLQAEQVYPLQGLVLTPWSTIDDARQDPAIQLFLRYAQRVQPGFSLCEEHLQALQQIFQMVGGMPLAIILAAGWVEVLSPAEILSEIRRNLDLLEATMRDIPDRHHSIRAVFDGTWNRLPEREQQLFAALSVFRGGLTLEAGREVAQATPRDLMKLVDQSLLLREENGRFETHELLRQFAAQELGRSPAQEQEITYRHSRYFCDFIQQQEKAIKGPGFDDAAVAITADFENILKAWYWAVDNAPELVLQAQRSFGFYAVRTAGRRIGTKPFLYAADKLTNFENLNQGQMAELLAWAGLNSREDITNLADKFITRAQKYLEIAENNGEDVRAEKAFLLFVTGNKHGHNFETTVKFLEESLALYESLEAHWEMAWIKSRLGYHYHTQADYFLSTEIYQQAMALYEKVGDKKGVLAAKLSLSVNDTWSGRLEEAEILNQELLTAYKKANDRRGLFDYYRESSFAKLFYGRFEEAIISINKSNALYETLYIEWVWIIRAWALLHLGRYDEALAVIQPILKGNVEVRQISNYFLGLALFIKGCRSLALKEGNVAGGDFLESRSLHDARDESSWPLVGLIYTNLFTGNTAEAQQILIEILELNLFLPLIQALPAAALLMAELGHTERAIELHAHALTHPFIANSQCFRDVALDKLDALSETLPPETVAAAQERGRSLDLWQTAESLLQELTRVESH